MYNIIIYFLIFKLFKFRIFNQRLVLSFHFINTRKYKLIFLKKKRERELHLVYILDVYKELSNILV